jgi:hypothetical protein
MKHWLQKLLVVSMIGAACVQVEVARAQYQLSHRSETYQELEGGLVIPMPWADTVNPYTYVDLYGLTFKIFGEDFKIDSINPIAISKWGNIDLRTEKSSVIIDAFHTPSLDSASENTQVSLDVIGEPGDKILKIQWRDMGFTGFPKDVRINFQMWMYERTGEVEFHYGPHSLGCDKTDPTLQGGYVGMFIAKLDFSVINKICWIYGEPENPKISRVNIKPMHCPFEANTSVSLNAMVAGVSLQDRETVPSGLLATRNGSIAIDNASALRLYSVMGQLLRSADRANESISADGIAAGRYFLEFQRDGETERRAVIIE